MQIAKKKVLKTLLLPEVFPRLKDLFGSGFGMIAYLVALTYNTVRILPADHLYLKPEMIGKYSVLQVIREASHHVRIRKENLDQIIIFFTILTGIVIFVFQFIVVLIGIGIKTANAQVKMPDSTEGFFRTPNPQEDLSFRMLDLIFGIPNIFNSKEDVGTGIHLALHAMFKFYSMGMVAVGAIIILYFVTTLVAETARTGVPFGQRSNKTWMAPRVILFFGLLIPFTTGINGGQYITLYSAKLGSLLASSGWGIYHESIAYAGSTLTGKKEQNVALPNPTDISHIPAFMLVTKTCEKAYQKIWTEDFSNPESGVSTQWTKDGLKAWLIYKTPTTGDNTDAGGKDCTGEKVGDHTVLEMSDQSYQDLAACAKNDIYVSFGVKDPGKFEKYKGGVLPVCGSLVMSTTDVSQEGSAVIQDGYFKLIKETWKGDVNDLNKYAEAFVSRTMNVSPDPSAEIPDSDYIKAWMKYLDNYMGDETKGLVKEAVEAQVNSGDWQMSDTIKEYGWAGAGIWYNKIAEQNGALVSAIRYPPQSVSAPSIQEKNKARSLGKDLNPARPNIYSTTQSAEGVMATYDLPKEKEVSRALNAVYQYWNGNKFTPEKQLTQNVIIDTINLIFGTYGLFELCKNVDIHPMAQLSAVGKSMIDSSVVSLFASGLTGIAAIIPSGFSPGLNAASSFFGTIAGIGLLVGFMLFYVLPFFPFMYFFFAVGSWVKTIFEAMVAVPLWALAHLRIDGDGIPGEAAIHGYYLIFEIFIRPILIVFGLIAALTIFAAMVKVLNEIFYLVISNLSGDDPRSTTVCFQPPDGASEAEKATATGKQAKLNDMYRGPIDEFFFTIIYAVIVYIIAQSCFKLIDMIPKQILRWIGIEVPSFLDDQGDAAEGLMTYVTLGGSQFGSQIGSSLSGLSQGAQASVQQFMTQGKK